MIKVIVSRPSGKLPFALMQTIAPNPLTDRFLYRYLGISIGLIYLWFGGLKFFPAYSPAEGLATETISMLFGGIIPAKTAMILLASWEVGVGLLLIMNWWIKPAIVLALVHMLFTFSPLFLLPEASFTAAPFCFTLVGQYILKNLVIIGALLILYRNES